MASQAKTIVRKAEHNFEASLQRLEDFIQEQRIEREKSEQALQFQFEQGRQGRNERIGANGQETVIRLAEFQMKQGCYEQLENSEELFRALESYKADLAQLLEQKDEMIRGLRESLQTEEEYYVAGIQNFHREFEDLLATARKEYQLSRETATRVLREGEEEFLQERAKIESAAREELNAMFLTHEKLEASSLQTREQDEFRNFKELNQLRQEKNREFAELKLHFEAEIQNHEKCLEDMKAIYQLNAEKLNYNFKVLTEKKDENTNYAMVLKKKERFFLDLLKRKNDDFALKDIELRKSNNKLTEQNKDITKKYRELHRKFEHFKKADIENYHQTRQVSLQEIEGLKRQILNCHQIIADQQLGMPTAEGLEPEQGAARAPELAEEDSALHPRADDQSLQSSRRSLHVSNAQHSSDKDHSRLNGEEPSARPAASFGQEARNALLKMVLAETEFLLDDKILSEIEALPDAKDKFLRRLDLLTKVLNLKSKAEAEDWLFKLHVSCLSMDEKDYDQDLLIRGLSKLLDSPASASSKSNARKPKDDDFHAKSRSRQAAQLQEQDFWRRASAVLKPETLELWGLLEKFSRRYYETLKARKDLILGNRELAASNDELRRTLEHYRAQDTGLIFPPKL